MKRKEKNKTVNKNLIILVVVALTFAVVLYLNSNKTNTSLPASQPNTSVDSGVYTRIYRSKDLKFSVNVSSKFQIEEKFTMVNLRDGGGKIAIDRIGTNFDSLEGYLQDLAAKNKILIINRNNYKIGSLNSISSTIRYPISKRPDEKSYFIYADGWVYSISTASEALFSDLDKIAQSFRYTP